MICWLIWLLLFQLVPHCPSRAGAFPEFFCNGVSLLYGPQLVLPAFSGETAPWTQNPIEKGQKLRFSHTSLRPCSASLTCGVAEGFQSNYQPGAAPEVLLGAESMAERVGVGHVTRSDRSACSPPSPGCRQLGQRTPCWRSRSLQALGQRTAGRLTELSREAWLSRAPPGEKWGPPQTAENNRADGCSEVLFRPRPAALTEARFNVFLASRKQLQLQGKRYPLEQADGSLWSEAVQGSLRHHSLSLSLFFFFF